MSNISAIVVSCNEGYLLDKCLSSITFCDEIIVVDLESTDDTKQIAEKYDAKYILHERVPVVEQVHAWIQNKTKYEWILITDPDEVYSKTLANDLSCFISSNEIDTIASVKVPCQFYFGKYKLRGTQWGGLRYRICLVNRKGFYFTGNLHRGRHLKKGYKEYILPLRNDNILHHYWMQNKRQLIVKHRRYLKKEGESKFNSGERVNLKQIPIIYFKSFFDSFYKLKGWKDGYVGFYLSVFWAWYNGSSNIKLWNYQRKIKNNITDNY